MLTFSPRGHNFAHTLQLTRVTIVMPQNEFERACEPGPNCEPLRYISHVDTKKWFSAWPSFEEVKRCINKEKFTGCD